MIAGGEGELASDFLKGGLGVWETEVVAEEGRFGGAGEGGRGGGGSGLRDEGGSFGEEVGEHRGVSGVVVVQLCSCS